MEIVQTWITGKANDRTAAAGQLVTAYIKRCGRFCVCGREMFLTEASFWEWVERSKKVRTVVVALDGAGRQMSSEEFAGRVGGWRDDGVRRLVLGIGPADGWSYESRTRANLLLSLGLITLPHELARLVLAEQVYRALTILAGHPYHCGH